MFVVIFLGSTGANGFGPYETLNEARETREKPATSGVVGITDILLCELKKEW